MADVMMQLGGVGELYNRGDYPGGLLRIGEIWDSIPEPKTDTPNSYLLLEYAVKIAMQVGDLDEAWRWALLAPAYNRQRQDLGEAEFLVGKVAFERGDMEVARNQLRIADEKSRGRIFLGEDPKYKASITFEAGTRQR